MRGGDVEGNIICAVEATTTDTASATSNEEFIWNVGQCDGVVLPKRKPVVGDNVKEDEDVDKRGNGVVEELNAADLDWSVDGRGEVAVHPRDELVLFRGADQGEIGCVEGGAG